MTTTPPITAAPDIEASAAADARFTWPAGSEPRLTGQKPYASADITIAASCGAIVTRYRDEDPVRFSLSGYIIKKDGRPGLQRGSITVTADELARLGLPDVERLLAQARVASAQRLLEQEQARLTSLA